VKALSAQVGHDGISIAVDHYGHLLPGTEEEAAVLLDAYLARGGPVSPRQPYDALCRTSHRRSVEPRQSRGRGESECGVRL